MSNIEQVIALLSVILGQYIGMDLGENEREKVVRNFFARTTARVESIKALLDLKNYNDAAMLLRGLIESYFYMLYLEKNNSFEDFSNFSNLERIAFRTKIRGDKELSDENPHDSSISFADRELYKALTANPPKWKEPKIEAISKEFEGSIIYKYGYDYLSKIVHPRSYEGLVDFNLKAMLMEDDKEYFEYLNRNTVLIAVSHIGDCLRVSTKSWRPEFSRVVLDLQVNVKDGKNTVSATLHELLKTNIENPMLSLYRD